MARFLENGNNRLLEDGSTRLLESGAVAPVYVAAGAAGASIGAITNLAVPAGVQENDILVVLWQFNRADYDGGFRVDTAGWNTLHQGSANNGFANSTAAGVLWRVATNSEPSTYAFADSGDHNLMQMFAVRNADTFNPFNQSALTQAPAQGSSVTPNITTTLDNCFVVWGLHGGSAISHTWSGTSNLINEQEFFDSSTTAGDDGALCLYGGDLPTAGSSGTKNYTVSAGVPYTLISSMAFRPIQPTSGPNIDTQPQNTTVADETQATFTVSATSSGGTLTYQWYEAAGDVLIPGATSATYQFITEYSTDNGAGYYVIVTDDNGATQSDTATLTVTKIATNITLQPQDDFVLDGATAEYMTMATGKATLSYQWFETTAGLLSGETATTLSFTAFNADNGKSYYAVVTDGYGDTTQSNTAALTIVTAPVIVTPPQDVTVIEYRDHTFTVTATGNAPLVYDWYKVGTGLVAADNGPSYTLTAIQLADSGDQFYCVVTDVYTHTTQSATATLTVRASNHPDSPPFIDADIVGPFDQNVFYGQVATFSITMGTSVSTPPYVVDWYNDINGLVYPNAGLSIQHQSTLAEDGSQWWVVVQDNAGLYGQSGLATMAIVPAQLELSWSIENAKPDTTVIAYQSIAWSVFDAKSAIKDGSFTCPVRTYRAISNDDGRTYWIPFYDKSARCERGPLKNDEYNRYYWTQDGQDMRYDTFQNLEWNQFTEGYDVGVPPPAKVPAVAAPAITSTDDVFVTRAYVYTYVTVYGEEGPPSNPTTANGVDGEVWQISNMLTGPDDGKRRLLAKKNIYRTVPSETGTAEFHYVGSVGIGTTVYFDRARDSAIAQNNLLESTNWFPPPEGLKGLIAHPNGFFVGYTDRDIHMSVPYRPHAWDPDYSVSTLGDVVGFGVFGNTVVVCTTSFPYMLTGINPAAMVMTQHDTPEPCLSRYGIVSMPFGVYYPGPNGLMLVSPQGVSTATQQLMTKEEWQNRYQVKTFDAAQYQSQYVALYTPSKGIMFAPDEPIAALIDIDLASGTYEPDQADSIFTDDYSGKTYLLSNCEMYEWNPVSGAPLEFDWTSMEFDASDPVNFGASRIIWYSDYTPPSPEETWAWRIYNTSRIAAAPLHPMNFAMINGVKEITGLVYDLTVLDAYPEINQTKVQEYLDNFEQIKQTFHWGPLIWVPAIGAKWPNTPYVIMELIANGETVYEQEVSDTQMFRLPSGFKATRFKIRLRSNINIQSVKVAETGRELAGF